jgi:hypothetical protein
MEKFSVLAIFAVLFIAGCAQNVDVSEIAKAQPLVQQFIDEHPGSTLKAIYIPQESVSGNMDQIRLDCGDQMVAKNYYFVNVTNPDFNLIAFIDPVGQTLDCSIVKDTRTGSITKPNPIGQYSKSVFVESCFTDKELAIIENNGKGVLNNGDIHVFLDDVNQNCQIKAEGLQPGETLNCKLNATGIVGYLTVQTSSEKVIGASNCEVSPEHVVRDSSKNVSFVLCNKDAGFLMLRNTGTSRISREDIVIFIDGFKIYCDDVGQTAEPDGNFGCNLGPALRSAQNIEIITPGSYVKTACIG